MTTTPIGWPEAQRICDIPEVREALDKFAEDAREENTLAMVSAIMGHASAQGRAAGLEEAAKICEKLGDDYDMKESHKWPELKSDAYTGCQDCESAIRALITSPTTSDAGKDDALLTIARDALEEIALAGMSGSGQESEDGMRDWHARRAWEFIGIAARAKTAIDAALSSLEVIGKGEKK
ncbi:hypothetical protein [Herbaspirillum huttiense]|uniref:hypothetical protein n=1 Tax=Herbaspirillum huttiense TaxID=863372 RepID=UPI002E790093|nr:hypothetical protein [Herbaspirillum huttiense]MEE1636393.1 hypothetical protein [Herbaspirillum huttiense NC40101]